jgi:dienelactone hydrolase
MTRRQPTTVTRCRGRTGPLFQAAFASFNPNAPTKVDFRKRDCAPLLVVGNGADHTVPASVSKEAAGRLAKSGTVVEYKEFPGRPHFTAGAPGWEEVADHAHDWAAGQASAPAQPEQPGTS